MGSNPEGKGSSVVPQKVVGQAKGERSKKEGEGGLTLTILGEMNHSCVDPSAVAYNFSATRCKQLVLHGG